MVVFSFRSVATHQPGLSLWRTPGIVPIVVPVFARPLPSRPLPPRPRRCPICNHAHVAPRCRHSVSCAADIIARPDARRRRRRGCSRVFSPANDIMIIHRGKKGIRGSVQASSVTRKREMSLLVSNSLSFFLSFFRRGYSRSWEFKIRCSLADLGREGRNDN